MNPGLAQIADQFSPLDAFPNAAVALVEPEIVFVRDRRADAPAQVGDAPHFLRMQIGAPHVLRIVPMPVINGRAPEVLLARVVPLESGLPVLELLARVIEVALVHSDEAVGRIERAARRKRLGVKLQLRGHQKLSLSHRSQVSVPEARGPRTQIVEADEQAFAGLGIVEHEIRMEAGASVVDVIGTEAGSAGKGIEGAVGLLVNLLDPHLVRALPCAASLPVMELKPRRQFHRGAAGGSC